MKTIAFTATAAKELDALPVQARTSVEAALDHYAMTGLGDVKTLKGAEGYRLRVGDYRVIFDEDRITILAIAIGRRQTTTYRKR